MRMIAFHRMRVGLANHMPVWRPHVGTGFLVIGIQETGGQMRYVILQALEGCSITTTEYPGKSSPCAMIHGFDDPELLFF